MEQDTVATSTPPPRTSIVLGLLALTALTFSYLGTYALTNALVANEVIRAWPRDHDPRPKWLLIGFCVLMLVFIVTGEVFRQMSKRDLQEIDAMTEAMD
jgi:hypothetical protein